MVEVTPYDDTLVLPCVFYNILYNDDAETLVSECTDFISNNDILMGKLNMKNIF